MPLSNTPQTYGTVARTLHWLTALLILTAIPLGLVAQDLPWETSAELARKAQVFSLHKTVGAASFAVALLRILWALRQPRPRPLHPARRVETWLAETVHWTLYGALVAVPLTGWITHAATEGFAPILWPLGQSLPMVPKSEGVAALAGSLHWVFGKLLIASILLHVAGALKHALLDRDATLGRMLPGRRPAPEVPAHRGPHRGAVAAALALYLVGFGTAVAVTAPEGPAAPAAPALAATEGGNWQVTSGTLGIEVVQFGKTVAGSFADWTARIAFDPQPTDGAQGSVEVEIAVPSLTLGSVTQQAMGAAYFAAGEFPTARFAADIMPAEAEGSYHATGMLTLKGQEVPVTLPFTLRIEGDTATMTGRTTLDRRDYGIGAGEDDPKNLGFEVAVTVDLTAQRTD